MRTHKYIFKSNSNRAKKDFVASFKALLLEKCKSAFCVATLDHWRGKAKFEGRTSSTKRAEGEEREEDTIGACQKSSKAKIKRSLTVEDLGRTLPKTSPRIRRSWNNGSRGMSEAGTQTQSR